VPIADLQPRLKGSLLDHLVPIVLHSVVLAYAKPHLEEQLAVVALERLTIGWVWSDVFWLILWAGACLLVLMLPGILLPMLRRRFDCTFKTCWIREGEGESKVVEPVSSPWLFVIHSLITPCVTVWMPWVTLLVIHWLITSYIHSLHFIGSLNFLWVLWDRNRQTLVDKLMGTYEVAQAEGGDYDTWCKKPGFFAHSGPARRIRANHVVCPQGSQVPLARITTRNKGNVLDVVIPGLLTVATYKLEAHPSAHFLVHICPLLFLLCQGNTLGMDLVDVSMCWVRKGPGESKMITPVSLPWQVIISYVISPVLTSLTGSLCFLWMFIDRNGQTLVDKLMGTYYVHEKVVGGGRF